MISSSVPSSNGFAPIAEVLEDSMKKMESVGQALPNFSKLKLNLKIPFNGN